MSEDSTQTASERAVANPNRPQEDRVRDAGRRPAEVMEFCGISAGMTVLEFQAGTGYYAEVLSYLVAEQGHVIAQNHSRDGVLDDEVFERRYGDNRLPNTELLFARHNEMELASASLDAVLMSLVYHDTYWYSPDVDWGPVDRPGLLADLFAGLKPGAKMCVIDHYATAGTAPEISAHATHRIDPAVVKQDFALAGFELNGESELLRNVDDDYSLSIFDERVYGKTDRFLLLFNRPD
jgi:predicted methyltransferase